MTLWLSFLSQAWCVNPMAGVPNIRGLVIGALAVLLAVYPTAGSRAASNHELILKDTDLARSEEGRQLLKYLIECALPEGKTVSVRRGGEIIDKFHGAIGLAPNWQGDGLDLVSRRKVSSCIFARTNAFGVKVRISIRGQSGRDIPEALMASEEELKSHSVFEGAFYGDIFAAGSPAFACTGPRDLLHIELLRTRKRVCTLSSDGDPTGISACGFRVVGMCSDPQVFTVDGVKYEDPIYVYLSP